MYRITTNNPLREFRFLRDHNKSGLTFLEFCYGLGFITINEYTNLRNKALGGNLK